MSFDHNRTEEYYKRFIELQEKLRKSEEERLKLEMKFNEMVSASREETQTHYRKLRTQYKRFLEEDRRRQERNERIMRTLERIESRFSMLVAKTDRFKQLREQYQNLLKRVYRDQEVGHKKSTPQLDSSSVQTGKLQNSTVPGIRKTPTVMVENPDDIVQKYLESVSSETLKNLLQKKEQHSDFKRRMPFTLCSDPMIGDQNKNYHEDFSHAFREGEYYKPNSANFIAEDIMSSIYNSRQARPPAAYVKNPKSTIASDFDRSEFCGATNLNLSKNPPKTSTAHLEKQPEEFCGTKDYGLGNLPNGFDLKKHALTVKNPELNSDHSDADDDLSDSKEIDTSKLIRNQHWNKLRDKLPQLYDNSVPGTQYVDRNLRKLDVEVFSSPQKIDLVKKSHEQLPFSQTQYIGEPLEDRESQKTVEQSNTKSSQDRRAELLKKLQHNLEPGYNVEQSPESTEEVQPKSRSLNQYRDLTVQKMTVIQPASCDENEKLLEDNQQIQPLDTEESLGIQQSSVEKLTISNDPHQQTRPTAEDIRDDPKIQQYQYDTEDKFETQPEYYGNELTDQGSEQYDSSSVQPIDQHSKVVEELSYAEPAQDAQLLDERYDQDIRPTHQQSYDQNTDQLNDDTTKKKLEVQYDQDGPMTQYDPSIKYDEAGQVLQSIQPNEEQFDLTVDQPDKDIENEPLEMQYDPSGQPLTSQYDPETVQYDETVEEQHDGNANQPDEVTQDQNGQPQYDLALVQYDENGHPIMSSYDQLQQQQYMYDENGQLIPQYDENGQLIQQYDESGQLIQQQYDASGQYIQQYDENGQPIYQYDESGQPIYQYDESGQMVQGYDENGAPLQQYDENGQLIQQYDQSEVSAQQHVSNSQNVEQYGDIERPIQQLDDETQPVLQYSENYQDVQQDNEVEQPIQPSDRQILETVESPVSADMLIDPTSDANIPPLSTTDVEPPVISQDDAKMLKTPNQPKNVMEMLDTDTENSLKQEENTNKISNDSDFDFSNG